MYAFIWYFYFNVCPVFKEHFTVHIRNIVLAYHIAEYGIYILLALYFCWTSQTPSQNVLGGDALRERLQRQMKIEKDVSFVGYTSLMPPTHKVWKLEIVPIWLHC